jgi:polyhydroxybutyrate depolymerase
MMKKIIILCYVFIVLACSKDNDKTDTVCYSNSNTESIIHDGIDREYFLYVPDSYDGTTAVPIVFNFHGYGGNVEEFVEYGDLRSVAETNTFILVYPQGSCLEGSPHWNACPNGPDNKSEADDFGFVEAMINQISSEYNIDHDRIYAGGYSNGGMMAYGLAHYKSDLIAAVASVSGVMLDCTSTPSHPIPVVHLHGTFDGVLPYDGNNDWNSVQSTLDYWINFNSTTTTPTVNLENSGGIAIEHYSYGQGENSVSVEHYKYIGGEHVWFNETYQGKSTSELIWNFMSRYDLNGLR